MSVAEWCLVVVCTGYIILIQYNSRFTSQCLLLAEITTTKGQKNKKKGKKKQSNIWYCRYLWY